MLSRSSTVLAMSGLVRVGRVPDVVVRLFAQRPPLILPAVFAARAHHIHTDARVPFDSDGTRDRLQAGLGRLALTLMSRLRSGVSETSAAGIVFMVE